MLYVASCQVMTKLHKYLSFSTPRTLLDSKPSPSLVIVFITHYPLQSQHPCPPTHYPAHTCMQTHRPFLLAQLSARCWESLVACMPVASWRESRKTCCCFRGCWPVRHLFQGNRTQQEIRRVENTHGDNDGKKQPYKNVDSSGKPDVQS